LCELQGRKICEQENQHEQVAADIPPKHRFTQELHGATSQKTAFFIVTAAKTSNLTQDDILWDSSEQSGKSALSLEKESETEGSLDELSEFIKKIERNVDVVKILNCPFILVYFPLLISFNVKVKVKVKISLLQAVEAHRVARGHGSHIT
jgi:hypothetical protein